ncbi:MAG: hypothetical protein GY816_12045 [Cytophagales bacterium]|nr:hypothetical protein [Cytophagales bacterium]
MPPTGVFLGDLTDEIQKDYGSGAYISEFVSGGPKNYGYRVSLPSGEEKECIKIKGHSLNYSVSRVLNFNLMKELVFEFAQGSSENKEVKVNYRQIRRKEGPTVTTVSGEKIYRIVYNKRVVKNNFETIPYGYM